MYRSKTRFGNLKLNIYFEQCNNCYALPSNRYNGGSREVMERMLGAWVAGECVGEGGRGCGGSVCLGKDGRITSSHHGTDANASNNIFRQW